MAWGWKQSAAHQDVTGTSTTVAVTPGSALTSGSTMIAVVGCSHGSTVTASTVKDAAGNNFVEIKSSGYNNGQETSLWALNTPAGDAGATPAITATFTTGATGAIVLVEFTGIVTATTAAQFTDGTATAKFASTAAATGTSGYTSTALNELLVMGYADDGGPLTWTIPTGATNDNNGGTAHGFNSDSNIDCELAFKNSTNGAENDSWGLSGTATGWGIVCAAFKLAAGASVSGQAQPRATVPLPRRRAARVTWSSEAALLNAHGPSGVTPGLMTSRTEVTGRSTGRIIRR